MTRQLKLLFIALLATATSPLLQAASITARLMPGTEYIEIFLDGRDVKPPFTLGAANLEVVCIDKTGKESINKVRFPHRGLMPGYYRAATLLPSICVKVTGFGEYTITLSRGKADGFGEAEAGQVISRPPKGHHKMIKSRFNRPVVNGYRVDWCKIWGAQCGKPAATQFCQKIGYKHAVNWEVENDIGLSTATIVLADGRLCDKAFCDGFAYIQCQ
ncbi:MAG: hypothetical protein L3J26_02740 [Candidatus Polarisedimenticolaceae bacterium]|nr:hypothetical protein [Candidatus Polarisedimenticolaceae bacterium]